MVRPHFFYTAADPMFDRMNCTRNRVQFIRWQWLANAMKKMYGGRCEAGIDETMPVALPIRANPRTPRYIE
jgi:hypothetical protein